MLWPLAKHLDMYHPDNIGDADCFNYSSVATFRKRLERQISEGVAIITTDDKVQANRQQHILMNSKSEHKSLQPAHMGPELQNSFKEGPSGD